MVNVPSDACAHMLTLPVPRAGPEYKALQKLLTGKIFIAHA